MIKTFYLSLLILTSILTQLNGQITDTIKINQRSSTQLIFNSPVRNHNLALEGQTGIKIMNNLVFLQSLVSEKEFVNYSNLFVETSNKGYYNFYLIYEENAVNQTISVEGGVLFDKAYQSEKIQSKNNDYIFASKDISNRERKKEAKQTIVSSNDQNAVMIQKIIQHKEIFKPSRDIHSDCLLQFYSHFTIGDKLYFKIKMENNSALDYPIQEFNLRAEKINKKKKKDQKIIPFKILNNTQEVRGNREHYFIIQTERFSIDNDQEVVLSLKEDYNGSRDFTLGIPFYIINKPLKLY